MKCRECGADVAGGKKFCTSCGAGLDPDAGRSHGSAEPSARPPEIAPGPVTPVRTGAGRFSDRGTAWKVLAVVLALLVLAGAVTGVVLIVMASTGGTNLTAKISALTLTRKDGKKLDLEKVPLGVDLRLEAFFTSKYPQGGRGLIEFEVDDESGEELTGDTFEAGSGSGMQKKSFTVYMSAGSGKPVKAIAKLTVTSGTGARLTDEKSLTFTAEKGSIEEDEEGGEGSDSELEQARRNVRSDFEALVALVEEADAAGIDLSDLTAQIEEIGSGIESAETVEDLDAIDTRIAELEEDIRSRAGE